MFAIYSCGHSNYMGEINKPEKQAIAYAKSHVKKLPHQPQLKRFYISGGNVGDNYTTHEIFKAIPICVALCRKKKEKK